MSRGSVFILSGPSGSGKDTVLKELFRQHPDLLFSISSITRAMREGEREGEKYHFISREEFEAMLKADELLEYNIYGGNYYGTPRKPVEAAIMAGKNMVIEVDVNGAEKIRCKLPEAVSIFIMPPSFAELKRRLVGRGTESDEQIKIRMQTALDEIRRADEYDYIIVNQDVNTAAAELFTVIDSRRLTAEKQQTIINEVLAEC